MHRVGCRRRQQLGTECCSVVLTKTLGQLHATLTHDLYDTTYSNIAIGPRDTRKDKEHIAVLMLCSDPNWTPVEGRTYKLRIENFDTTIVDATVESFTRSGGELLVRLMVSGDINMGNIMYTRNCSVQLGESVDSLTVPARALHSQNGKTGVVMATESGAYWTPVTVIGTEGDSAHIIPENAGVLYEGIPVLLF